MIAAFHTLGCKTNAYETQAILEQFRRAGFEIGEFSHKCDVYVINTCAVTAEAARKSRQIAGRCKRLNPDSLVVVTGCYAQEAGEELIEKVHADLVVGNGEKSRILSLVNQRIANRNQNKPDENRKPEENPEIPQVLLHNQMRRREYEQQQISGQQDHVRAYVKIQDGCDRFCSYCIIPYLRGRSVSRSLMDILSEVRQLAQEGYPEIVLTGIDISSFQNDASDGIQAGLADLLEEIAKIPGIRRIRLGSLEAGIASEELIRRLQQIPAFCPQFHLSLQSGSDSVLSRMNRHYTTGEFAACVEMIRRYFPNAGITTDIITGFPGESSEEFSQTLEFVRQIAFSRLHVFPYSRRKGTRADEMPGQIPKTEKEHRARQLIALGEELREEYERQRIGISCAVLIEEAEFANVPADMRDGTVWLYGYTKEYIRIRVELTTHQTQWKSLDEIKKAYIGKIVTVIPKKFQQGILCARM